MQKKSKIVFETPYFNVEEESAPNGRFSPFYKINCPNAVVIVSKTEDGKLILIRQFRQAISKYTLEFPAGAVDSGEKPEDAAKREFLEETGYECGKLSYVGSGNEFASRLNVQINIFYGEGAVKKENYPKEDGMEVVLISPKELKDLIETGNMNNFSLLGVLLFVQYRIKHKNILDIF